MAQLRRDPVDYCRWTKIVSMRRANVYAGREIVRHGANGLLIPHAMAYGLL